MRYFPIFVDLKGRRVLVVGGGEEATRKVRLLLKTDAVIEVVARSNEDQFAGRVIAVGAREVEINEEPGPVVRANL